MIAKLLIGNTFPVSLIRRKALFEPMELEELKQRLQASEIFPFGDTATHLLQPIICWGSIFLRQFPDLCLGFPAAVFPVWREMNLRKYGFCRLITVKISVRLRGKK